LCGIVGYTGKNLAFQPIIDGLKALEYRGYDSAGITLVKKYQTKTFKAVGRVQNAAEAALGDNLVEGASCGIGHTRWATHGEPSTDNAHPHANTTGTISVVHNGIIENYREIKEMLLSNGYVFKSETDTEVIPHLIDYHLQQNKDFEAAFVASLQDLNGAYAIAATTTEHPDKLFVARLSSPLVIGVGDGEHFVASDPTAIMKHTKKVVFLNDYEFAVIGPDKLKAHNFKEEKAVTHTAAELDFDIQHAKLGDFDHFMIKEIFETPDTVRAATRGRIRPSTNTVKLGGLEIVSEQLQYIDRIVIVACGTSYYAGLVGEYLIEELASIPVEVQLASEFKYRNEPFSRSTALLAISQSGETADTIAAIKKVEGYGVLKLGIVNAVGSTIARMTDAGVYCHAGPELSVASTKAFIAQVTVLAEIALHLSRGNTPHFSSILKELQELPEQIEELLKTTKEIKKMAKKYSKYRDFLFIGRGYSYPVALEGSLKLKELSYIHAEGYAAGEMKHGPLAMIDKNFPTLAVIDNGELHEKTLSNIEEIRARKGPALVVAPKGIANLNHLTKDIIEVPATSERLQPILSTVALQLFAYYVAVEKGLNVDRPRNLAKSVTVE
jgi:glutamine---fructose-6-phosphate transaminase (isomerizing)